jgi:pectin methylesterase-like acyl-CoA thioesterase
MRTDPLLSRGVAVVVILLFLGVAFAPSIHAHTSKTSLDGDILYVGGSGEGNYTKIQDAIDNASDGDTVFVYDDSSPYIEHIVVNKSIALIGEDKNSTTIDGSNESEIVIY